MAGETTGTPGESLERFARDRAQLEELTAANRRLLRQLERAKAKTTDLVEAVYRAAKDAADACEIAPVPPPPKDPRRRTGETAIAVLSDWQLAKHSSTYSTDTCEKRVGLYADKVSKFVEIQRADHPVRELRVWLLGDIVEGELIFPGQAHQIDASLYRQVLEDGPRIVCGFLQRMLSVFDAVHVIGVVGNHGALGGQHRRDYNPTSNADRMLYRVCQHRLNAEKRITWHIPAEENERDWYAIDKIGTHRFLLFHGDQIRGTWVGLPWYGFLRRVLGWATGAVSDPFQFAACGHWHQPTSLTLNNILVWVNGSLEGANTYAAENLAAAGRACQWLLFAHPEHGVTSEMRVWLE